MTVLSLEPIPCPRARVGRWGAYYPAKYKQWKERAEKLLTQLRPDSPFTTPVHVSVTFFCSRPKKTVLQTPKGDIDNHLKSLFDALTKAGWWTDDTLVRSVSAHKVWAKGDPCILFAVTTEEFST